MREETKTSRVGQAIDAAKERGGAAFVGYLPVGFPDLPGSIAGPAWLTRLQWLRP